MKKIINLLFVFISVFLINSFIPVQAGTADATLDGLNSTAGKVNAYTEQVKEKGTAQDWLTTKTGNLVSLALSFVGVAFLLLIIYAGLKWMFAQGNSSDVDSAKQLMINAIIGLIIITAAYSITLFIGKNIVE